MPSREITTTSLCLPSSRLIVYSFMGERFWGHLIFTPGAALRGCVR
jgi:hypothetical protein